MADTPSPRRVLVVDDDAAMRRLLEVILSRAGYAVDTAATGAQAIGALLGPTDGMPPPDVDVVLLDGVLPDMRGFELARRLLDHEATAQLPICFLTGAVHGRVSPSAGIACVVKPATPTQVVSALEGIIGASCADRDERRRAIDHVEELALL